MSDQQKYLHSMKEWGEACGEWQLANPEKDLLTELNRVVIEGADDGPGTNPPPPPPPPPPH